MNSTIDNPSIPYVGALPVPLQSGTVIRIQGVPNSSCTCFSINLQCSPVPRQDVALHLSPVFSPPPRLVRNSIQNQQWGPEESYGPSFPFTAGQSFEILILAEADEYKIAVNGYHFTEFTHRIPLHNITHLAIDGEVQIRLIKYEGSQIQQSKSSDVTMPIGFITPDNTSASAPEFRPPSPYGSGSSLPYPTGGMSLGPQPTTAGYPPSPSHPYGPPSPSHPYGPSSPSHPYGPPPGVANPYPTSGSPYGGSSPSHPYGPPPGGYPSSYQQGSLQHANYPYPSQPGPYPGSTVVYPASSEN